MNGALPTTYDVVVDPSEVAAFATVLGLPADSVPPTFAIRWLAHPTARVVLDSFLPTAASMAIHVGQRFRYCRDLRLGETLRCTLRVTAAGVDGPLTIVHLDLATPDGELVCEARTEIAIVEPGFAWNNRRPT